MPSYAATHTHTHTHSLQKRQFPQELIARTFHILSVWRRRNLSRESHISSKTGPDRSSSGFRFPIRQRLHPSTVAASTYWERRTVLTLSKPSGCAMQREWLGRIEYVTHLSAFHLIHGILIGLLVVFIKCITNSHLVCLKLVY